jgi:putative pyruvate formate lyase activating enzyme
MNLTSRSNSIKRASYLLKDSLGRCRICPRRCNVNRIAGEKGYCRAGSRAVVYSYAPHHGEEPPISGRTGSGTIFFSFCNMKCAYCQNYRFSQMDKGREVSAEGLADVMISLQGAGCHNINLVNPTHFVPQIISAIESANSRGLRIPIVYNTSGYELADTLKIMEGVMDIYLPDMRYSDNAAAKKYSDAHDYVEHNRESIKEMNRQVGTLVMDENGVALSGLLIRLLVLPDGISGLSATFNFIKEAIGKDTYLSIMSQYYPTFKAHDYDAISRKITPEEYKIVVDEALLLRLNNAWVQEMPSFDPRFFGTNIKPK